MLRLQDEGWARENVLPLQVCEVKEEGEKCRGGEETSCCEEAEEERERRKRKAGTRGAHSSGGGVGTQGPRWDAPFKERGGNR